MLLSQSRNLASFQAPTQIHGIVPRSATTPRGAAIDVNEIYHRMAPQTLKLAMSSWYSSLSAIEIHLHRKFWAKVTSLRNSQHHNSISKVFGTILLSVGQSQIQYAGSLISQVQSAIANVIRPSPYVFVTWAPTYWS